MRVQFWRYLRVTSLRSLISGFITASQAFAVMALLLYIGLFIIMTGIVVSMVYSIPYKKYVDRRCVIMLLAVGAFSAGEFNSYNYSSVIIYRIARNDGGKSSWLFSRSTANTNAFNYFMIFRSSKFNILKKSHIRRKCLNT